MFWNILIQGRTIFVYYSKFNTQIFKKEFSTMAAHPRYILGKETISAWVQSVTGILWLQCAAPLLCIHNSVQDTNFFPALTERIWQYKPCFRTENGIPQPIKSTIPDLHFRLHVIAVTPLHLGLPACTTPGVAQVSRPLPAPELRCVRAGQRSQAQKNLAFVRDLASGDT